MDFIGRTNISLALRSDGIERMSTLPEIVRTRYRSETSTRRV
jgi:hypothetical protein